MKLLAKFNLILLVIFGIGGFLIAHIAYTFLFDNASREVSNEAQLMMASALSVRDYTSTDLAPLLTQVPQHRVRFLAETVPAFGATTTLADLRKANPDYSDYLYKEAALNPTNPADRATDWEADIIETLRAHPGQTQITGTRDTPSGPSMYLARPLTVNKQSCLQCHSVPSAAPAAMLAVYGSNNGFGWKLNDTIGAQIISVPTAIPTAIATKAYHTLLFYLILGMIVTIVALDCGVYLFVIRPLKLVSDSADRVSRGEKDVPPITLRGKDEISIVAASFNRMQRSVAKALKMFEEE
jgi:HAMP domain-containing protein